MSKVIFVTGAGRGLGTDIARQALDAGHQVVATARNPQKVIEALGGQQDNFLATGLDITSPDAARSAAEAATERFGRIDVLINNAATFQAGYFEEISDAQMRAQIETNLFGPMNVTRAVLPVMRSQRAGHVVTISSIAGLVGQEFCVAYAASKFGVEGWMASWAELSLDEYAERTAETKKMWQSMNGQQAGDPAKLADALLKVIDLDQPPLRFVAGDDAIPTAEGKGKEIADQASASRALGTGLSHDDAA